jgi:hypothetical protein
LDVSNSSSTLHVSRENRYFGILPGEGYIGIRALVDLFLFAFKIPNREEEGEKVYSLGHAVPVCGVNPNYK